jgi:O-antigen ligase
VTIHAVIGNAAGRARHGSAETPRLAAVIAVAMAATLTDVFANAGLLPPMTAALAALALAGAALVRRPRPGWPDLGLGLLALAALWPRLVHLQPGAPGALLFIAATYAIGRLGGLTPRRLALLLVGAGAAMGAIAVAETLPSLSGVVAALPIREGQAVHGTRATGLFNNPNTFGTYEAMAVVLAVIVGLPWRWRAGRSGLAGAVLLFGALTLCLAGLGLSASRESVLGFAAGMAVFAMLPRDGWQGRLLSLRPYVVAGLAAVALVVVVAAIATVGSRTNLTGRFDPTTVTTDHNLLDRMASWRLAVDYIRHALLVGYGTALPMGSVDNAYLEWMLAGGVLGPVIWLAGVGFVAPRRTLPLAAAILVVALFANPFAVGPGLAILLISCGAMASYRDTDPANVPAMAQAAAPQ